MSTRLAASVLVLATAATVSAQTTAEPPALRLPTGARVRLRTQTAPQSWMKGYLASADDTTIALVPDGAPPLGANELRLPTASVTRVELVTGKKSLWLRGLVIGAVLGTAMGFAVDVDPVACKYDDNYSCTRGGALALLGGTGAVLGAGIGALVKTDRWTPVAIDALAPPPPPRVSGIVPRLRAQPGGGVGLDVAVGF